jgi:Spy/CpxP family protein refolding chaperone
MRNHYTIAGLVLALALAVSMIAAAQTSSSQPPTQGQATSPSQSAPSTQGSEPQASPQAPAGSQSQTVPQGQAGSQSQMPSQGQAGSVTSGGRGQAAGRGSSAEDELQLTEDQKAKLQPLIQDEMIQIDAVRTDNSLSMAQKQAKVAQIKKDHFPKIEAILTPEQRKKLADMQERARQQRQGPGGSQSNPQQPPQ